MAPLVVIGTGGHARELVTLARACGREVAGMAGDDEPTGEHLVRLGAPWLGPVASILGESNPLVVGFGLPAERARWVTSLDGGHQRFTTLVHPSAVLADDVTLGSGAVIHALCHVSTGVNVAQHVHVGAGSALAHDVALGSFTTLAPRVVLSGGVVTGEGVFIGAGAVVVPGCAIGEGTVVSAGAVVVGDVPAGVTAKGAPARW